MPLTPKQTADALLVSTSTLRRWSIEFFAFLAPRTSVRRLYTVEDLAVLRRVKDFFNAGQNTAQIGEALKTFDHEKPETTDLVNLRDFATALSLALVENSKLASKVEDMNKRLEALEAWHLEPWYKRIGKRPPHIE